MRTRFARRTLTASILVAAATLMAGSQAATAYEKNGCQESWMHVPGNPALAAMAFLVSDDSGKPTQDYTVRYETVSSKRYVVITVHPAATPCRRSFTG